MPLAMWEVQGSRKKDLCEKRAPETFPELSAGASLSIEENAHKRMPSEARETHTHKMGGRNPDSWSTDYVCNTEENQVFYRAPKYWDLVLSV